MTTLTLAPTRQLAHLWACACHTFAQQRPRSPRIAERIRALAAINATEPALDLVRRDPDLVVHIFEPDWAAVDRLRDAIAAEGLSNRVTVRVLDALSLVNLSRYDLVLANEQTRW